MRRVVWKRIGLTLLAVAAAVAATAGVLAFRATRVPAWYTAARDIPANSPLADRTLNDRLIPLQNWLARTSAGDLDAKPAAAKQATLTLTQDQINALLAKAFDHVPGPFVGYRIRLTPGRIDLACDWADWNRTVGVVIAVDPAARGPAVVRLGGVRLGDQGVPLRLLRGGPLDRLRAVLAEPGTRTRPNKIDDHDLAGPRTVTAYYGRVVLDLLAGRAVEPLAFLPGSPSGDDLVATKVDRLDVTDAAMTVTFRMLGPDERTAVLATVDGPPQSP